jgi:hypothetical protein
MSKKIRPFVPPLEFPTGIISSSVHDRRLSNVPNIYFSSEDAEDHDDITIIRRTGPSDIDSTGSPKSSSDTASQLPLWNSVHLRSGVIFILCHASMATILKSIVQSKFSTDPIELHLLDGFGEDESDVLAVSKGGLKWAIMPFESDIGTWLEKLLGGEVRWNEQSEDLCPIIYD